MIILTHNQLIFGFSQEQKPPELESRKGVGSANPRFGPRPCNGSPVCDRRPFPCPSTRVRRAFTWRATHRLRNS